jgi:hypothetical protein
VSYFDLPPGQRVLREFRVFRNANGRWVARWGVQQPRGSSTLRLVASEWRGCQSPLRTERDYSALIAPAPARGNSTMPANIDSSSLLDQVSRLRLRIFVFKMLIMAPVSIALALRHHYPMLATISFFCFWQGIFGGMAALLQGHNHNAAFLTAWDEMAAFLGLAALMRLTAAVVG